MAFLQNMQNLTPAPAPVADVPEALWDKLKSKYTEQLAELKDMGFDDEKATLKALNQTKGDIEGAVNILTVDAEKIASPASTAPVFSGTSYAYEEGEVVAHVYDISGGMAHSMSQMMIGKYMELLPHTGIVCFGKEYYFSQDPAQCEPGKSLPSPVKKTIKLGKTAKTQEDLDNFLRTVAVDYTATSYNFLTRNSNHYADAVAKFLLDGEGLPKELVSLAEDMQSTEQGRRMATMLEARERSMRANSGGRSAFTPTGALFHGGTPANPAIANMFGALQQQGGMPAPQQQAGTPGPQRFQRQLAELADMGFTNEQLCLRALTETNGNIEAAIEKIISQ